MQNTLHQSTCRICFQQQGTLFSLFLERNCSLSPYDKLVNKTKLKIEIDDAGPSSICSQCLSELEITVNFLDKCEKSNRILASLYSTSTVIFKSNCESKPDIYSNEICTEFKECKNVDKSITELASDVIQTNGIEEKGNEPRCPECGSRRRCRHWSPPTSHTCPHCHKVFTRKFNFKLHLKRHAGAREFACPACGRAQLTRALARRHCGPRRRRACPLPGCHKTFTTNTNLNTHIRAHNGERPYVCGECGKGFTSKNILNDHLRIHTGVKPYMCAECGALFATNKLAAHRRTHARATSSPAPATSAPVPTASLPAPSASPLSPAAPPRPHCCRRCPARYQHSQSLNKHVRRHHQPDGNNMNDAESKTTLDNHQ
ncbi:LOW QUALITY PROTEIN: uncharacterized protein ACR2FA_009642 [Aphomia sociella]